MQYRPEIDGLRAIAVIAVILYHAGFSLFKGGFVGVDIFFVISGYLITTILYTELKNQEFSFKIFYAKRAARILPPLFFVMAVSLPFAWVFLLPDYLKEFSKSLEWIPIFVSNIFFLRQSGYFDTAIEIKPLVHTWSLAVEEQYYLFFPILLLIIYRLKRNLILHFFLALGLVSFLLTQFHIFSEAANFYLLPMRAWELMTGVCLAIYLTDFRHHWLENKLINVMSGLGLLLILGSIFFVTNNHAYPGLYTVPSVIGTAFIILALSKKNLINQLLSNKLFVGIGLISYSAYLWHQPIFAFTRHISLAEPTHLTFTLLIIMTFFFAFLSWKYIEIPFRILGRTNRKKILKLYGIFAILFICLGAAGEKTLGFPQRFNQSNALKAKLTYPDFDCSDSNKEFCEVREKTGGGSDFAIFGDSHARALIPMFIQVNKIYKKSFVYNHGCPPLIGVHILNEPAFGDTCYEINKKRISYIQEHPNIKKVFLIARWTRYTNGDYQGKGLAFLGFKLLDERSVPKSRAVFTKALLDTVNAYKKLGVKIYIVMQAPQQVVHSGQLYFSIASKNLEDPQAANFIYSKSVPIAKHNQLQEFSREQLLQLEKLNGVEIINLDSAFCDNLVCLLGEVQNPYYTDYDHLSIFGAIKTSPLFFNAIQK